jgi:hypothetical protein
MWDVKVIRWRTECLLPRWCSGCGTTTTACPPDGGIVNGIRSGRILNTAAMALIAFGNVPVKRAGHLIGMLFGEDVSAGLVDGQRPGSARRYGRRGWPSRC